MIYGECKSYLNKVVSNVSIHILLIDITRNIVFYCTKYLLIYVIKRWYMSSIDTLVHSLVLDYKYDNIEYTPLSTFTI